MSKLIRNVKRKFSRMERGQVLVVVAFSMVGIIAIMGLVMDVGLVFIGNARLRRAVDAAALSAALQYRENSTIDSLTRAANEFLVLNGISNPNSTVSDCDNSPTDTTLCTVPPRKLVRVRATAVVHLAFLPVIGINTAPISAVATSETASLDVVLVIDRSESMTYGIDYDHPYDITDKRRDPSYCNTIASAQGNVSSCEPFNQVINAAIGFTKILFLPYDHVAVVTFDQEPHVNLALNSNCPTNGDPCTADNIMNEVLIPTLRNLTVFEGDGIYPNGSPSRCYDNRLPDKMLSCPICLDNRVWDPFSNYRGLFGEKQDYCQPDYNGDPSRYTTTNIGGALLLAGNEFSSDPRQQALWVVILLTDGVANAGHSNDGLTYYCPSSTWGNLPRCNDGVASSRHHLPNPLYDASDYAYDMADFAGKPYPDGQHALIYTIGLGPDVRNYNNLGQSFLDYAASDAVGRGQSFYAAQPSDLNTIFRLIGSNIATRLAH